MKKAELRNRLMAGEMLVDILPLKDGQDCLIYKADDFKPGVEILYIPDVFLNEIPVDKDLSCDIEGIFDVLGRCYTGDDFIEECDGNVELAERLFWYCDWQSPSSALPELEEDCE